MDPSIWRASAVFWAYRRLGGSDSLAGVEDAGGVGQRRVGAGVGCVSVGGEVAGDIDEKLCCPARAVVDVDFAVGSDGHDGVVSDGGAAEVVDGGRQRLWGAAGVGAHVAVSARADDGEREGDGGDTGGGDVDAIGGVAGDRDRGGGVGGDGSCDGSDAGAGVDDTGGVDRDVLAGACAGERGDGDCVVDLDVGHVAIEERPVGGTDLCSSEGEGTGDVGRRTGISSDGDFVAIRVKGGGAGGLVVGGG